MWWQKSQSTRFYRNPVCSEKNCQDTKFKQPVKPAMDMQSREPEMQSSFKMKHVTLCSDMNCQSTRCYKKKCPVRPVYGNDKNCQEAHSVQMQPKKPISNMWSVVKSSIPARKQSNHKKYEYIKCLCDGNNCQSANLMWNLNLKELIFFMWSVLKPDCK